MRKFIFFLMVFVLAACQSAPTVAPATTSAAPAEPLSTPTLAAAPATAPVPLAQYPTFTVWPVVREESSQSPSFSASMRIPTLAGSDDPRLQQVNQRLENIIQQELQAFKQTLAGWTPPPNFPPSAFYQSYQLLSAPGDLLSLKLDFSFYAAGAAHPGHYTITFNYDLHLGQEITLDQLFLHGVGHLQTLADFSKAELSKRDIAFDMFSDGANPTPENYRNWNITPTGLLITFDEYQVAPYAAGAQLVMVPYARIQNIINPDGPLGRYNLATGAPAGNVSPDEISAYLAGKIGSASFGGRVFCAHQLLGSDADHLYLLALCEEYYPKDGMLELGTGISVPVVLVLGHSDGRDSITGHVLPVDGEGYGSSIKANFPENTWRFIFSSTTEDIVSYNALTASFEQEVCQQAQAVYGLPCRPKGVG
jgi:hypothetical protein